MNTRAMPVPASFPTSGELPRKAYSVIPAKLLNLLLPCELLSPAVLGVKEEQAPSGLRAAAASWFTELTAETASCASLLGH